MDNSVEAKRETANICHFRPREMKLSEDLLRAWKENGLPVNFYEEKVFVMLDRKTREVFLTNSDYQVCMLIDGKLKLLYEGEENG